MSSRDSGEKNRYFYATCGGSWYTLRVGLRAMKCAGWNRGALCMLLMRLTYPCHYSKMMK